MEMTRGPSKRTTWSKLAGNHDDYKVAKECVPRIICNDSSINIALVYQVKFETLNELCEKDQADRACLKRHERRAY